MHTRSPSCNRTHSPPPVSVWGWLLLCLLTTLLAACASGGPVAEALGEAPAPSEGMARITVLRSDETVFSRQTAQAEINGGKIGEFRPKDAQTFEVAPGTYVFSVTTRAQAARNWLTLEAKANHAYRIDIVLDAQRFPADGGLGGTFRLLQNSLSASGDDRTPMFALVLRPAVEYAPKPADIRQAEALRGQAQPAAGVAPRALRDRPGPDNYTVWLTGRNQGCFGSIEMVEYKEALGVYLMQCPGGIGVFKCKEGKCARAE